MANDYLLNQSSQQEPLTVGQLAELSGVSVRTLHHYDAIGLLKPALIRPNGYRYYKLGELLRLQEILFYRAVGMALADIKALLDGPVSALERLQKHRADLAEHAKRQAEMMATLDATIAHLTGETIMANQDLYTPFSTEAQANYETWLIDTYGPGMAERIATSIDAITAMPDGMEGAMEALQSIETWLVDAYQGGTDAAHEHLHTALEEQRALMTELWGKPCQPEGLAGLADLYLSHPDFVARYERLAQGFSQWLPAAMKAHARRLDSDA
ncbi:MAG: MerR family transcriptional regulator [Pseudomonadota bacterium]